MKKFAPPLFESALLHDIASAIERRGKSIRYHGSLMCSRAVEAPFERLNVDVESILGWSIRLSIWSDGHLWLCVRELGSKSTGRRSKSVEIRSHVAEFDGFEVCKRFKQTINDRARVRDFWPNFSNHDRNA